MQPHVVQKQTDIKCAARCLWGHAGFPQLGTLSQRFSLREGKACEWKTVFRCGVRSILRQWYMPAEVTCSQLILPPFPGTVEVQLCWHLPLASWKKNHDYWGIAAHVFRPVNKKKKSSVENMDFCAHPLGCGTVWDCTCSKASLGLGCLLTLFGFRSGLLKAVRTCTQITLHDYRACSQSKHFFWPKSGRILRLPSEQSVLVFFFFVWVTPHWRACGLSPLSCSGPLVIRYHQVQYEPATAREAASCSCGNFKAFAALFKHERSCV